MAAALLAQLAERRVRVRSAGSAPADEINPVVIEAMEELGIDITHERPKLLEEGAAEASDIIVTMGCGDACPVYPGKRYLDWAVDDPSGQPIEVVRVIRDEIGTRVRRLLLELGVASEPGPSVAGL